MTFDEQRTSSGTQLPNGDTKLSTGDFDDRFSISPSGKLKFDGAIIETAIGLKRRDFILALTVAAITFSNMIASWVNARKAPAPPPPALQLSCPAPIINFQPPSSLPTPVSPLKTKKPPTIH